jgi:hypothetical protein
MHFEVYAVEGAQALPPVPEILGETTDRDDGRRSAHVC